MVAGLPTFYIWLILFLSSAYIASAELIPAQDFPNNINGNHRESLDLLQAMKVSLRPFQHRNEASKHKVRLSLLYLACLLLCQSSDINPNPGPKARHTPRWPCGDCHQNVHWRQKGILCENCETWFHASCQGMRSIIYETADNSNVEWLCTNCGVPNFSTTLFDLSSLENSNRFSVLSDTSSLSSPGLPLASSSPTHCSNPPCPKSKLLKSGSNIKSGVNTMRVVNINFQSILSKKAELHHLISSTNPDIIIGTETWLHDGIKTQEFLPDNLGYSVYRSDRKGTDHHGGVLIAVTKKMISDPVPELETNCEILWVKINLVGVNTLLVGAFYRPNMQDKKAIEELRLSLQGLNRSNATVWLAGDFNAPHIDWTIPGVQQGSPQATSHEELLGVIQDHGLENVVLEPTRGKNILDLFLTNHPVKVNRVEIMPPISDHNTVFIEVNLKAKIIKQKPRTIHLYNKGDWTAIQHGLQQTLNQLRHMDNVNDMWLTFKTKCLDLINRHIPTKLAKASNGLPWVNQNLKKAIRRRNRAWSKWKKSKSQDAHTRYLSIKGKVQRMFRQSYWTYINDLINPPSEDGKVQGQKRFWSYIKSLKQDYSGIGSLKHDGKLITDTIGKAELLNHQFQSVFTKDPDETPPNKGPSPHPQMSPFKISLAGVVKLVKGLNVHKATGPDRINGRILKECGNVCAPILQLIFQKSLDTGLIPDDWRHANVTPLFKKGERYKAENYRPVSLTSICSKLMEHVIASQLMGHLNIHNILYALQHGFRDKRSCETQLLALVQELASGVNAKRQTDMAILDFSKAFDKVSHSRLLYKLKWYGVDPITLSWIANFLKDRTQAVVLDGESSTPVPVTSGVPQGTVLGPILFLVYINDLPECITYSKVRLFADDCILYRQIDSQADCVKLQTDLDALQRWEDMWLMSFNASKCNTMRVTSSPEPICFNYSIHNTTLENVPHTKYLGVTIQSNLKWDIHTKQVSAKATKTLNVLKRNLRSTREVREKAYKSLVRPQVEYSASVWSPWLAKDKTLLERVQRRSARYVCNTYSRYSSVTDMLKQLQWETLESRRATMRLCMFYKAYHGLSIFPLLEYASLANVNTRGHNIKFIAPQCSKDVYKFSFLPSTIRVWNTLPVATVEAATLNQFRASLPVVKY